MPSILGYSQPNQPTSNFRSQQLSEQNAAVVPVRATAPWMGWTPDIDVAHLGPSAASTIKGLIPRSDPSGRGEVLTHFPGFSHVDSTYASSTELGEDTGSTNYIVGLTFFPRRAANGDVSGEFDDTTIAVTAGDTTQDSCELWRVLPSTGLWEKIQHSGHVDSLSGAGTPDDGGLAGAYPAVDAPDGVQLWDFAVAPFSASPRTAAGGGNMTAMTDGGPLLIGTNNYDAVIVYAVDESSTQEDGYYEQLHSDTLGDFKARSVELWGDRLNFLNTVEGGTRYPRRLRRTAIGNADPDTVNDGSGAIDFEQFSGEGLRVESLGNVLACYFEDGVAFARRTGQAANPYTVQDITTERGLLATHSLCNLGGGVHFGLFTDGWFFLTENGQFTEAGITDVEGTPKHKWRETFFRRLYTTARARIDMRYDARNRWIWITLPLDEGSENNEVWVYDLQADRLFVRDIPVTKFGASNIQLTSAQTIGSLGLIGTLGTIGSLGASFGLSNIIHGTRTGHVFKHTPETETEIDIDTVSESTPSWTYQTVLSGLGAPHHIKTAREVFIEAIANSEDSFTSKLGGNSGETTSTVTHTVSASAVGKVKTYAAGHRFSSSQLYLELSGNAPFALRSFHLDLLQQTVRARG